MIAGSISSGSLVLPPYLKILIIDDINLNFDMVECFFAVIFSSLSSRLACSDL